jgi:AraC-like DNA-binding protein
MLLGGMQDRDASREEARNMALLQAGLGIMGGQSPYALQNIAQGALPATQAYQQQMAQARKEERETIGALAGIEMKAKELGLTEKRYADLVRIAEMQLAAASAKSTGLTPKDIADIRTKIAIKAMEEGFDPKKAAESANAAVEFVLGQSSSGGPSDRTVDLKDLK